MASMKRVVVKRKGDRYIVDVYQHAARGGQALVASATGEPGKGPGDLIASGKLSKLFPPAPKR